MPSARLAAACTLALLFAPMAARADELCDHLSKAVELATSGFGPAEGDPVSSDPDNHYWHSTIQLSAGDNCAIEAHKVLSCSWEPSTPDDLRKMKASVAACFPDAQQTVEPDTEGGPSGVSFKVNDASIDLGLTADVLSLSVGQ
jgi:hypothetical protein